MLKDVSCYQEHGKWYMSLKYEFYDKDGKRKHSIVIPKLDFPQILSQDPKMELAFRVNEILNAHPAPIMDPTTNEMFVDDLLEVISEVKF